MATQQAKRAGEGPNLDSSPFSPWPLVSIGQTPMRHCGQPSARGTPDKDRLNRWVRQQWFWHPRTMSGTRANDRSTGDEQHTGLDAIRENREALEAIAATDLLDGMAEQYQPSEPGKGEP